MENEANTFEEGAVLLIDKPLGWTSFDVVNKIRNTLKIKKVGHAGTLDPLASGLLIVCCGKFTKRIHEFMTQEKAYTGTFTMGATTPTYDLESEPGNFCSTENITSEDIYATARKFTGEMMQKPPIYSAIKKKGKPVYLMARKGKEVELEPRKINIKEFKITGIQLPVISFSIVCSTGTYIRSIANDFGQSLGCGAFLSSLRRTRIGAYHVSDAITIQTFLDRFNTGFSMHK
jgi:tRNA pseudouridine55 synthase